MSAAALFCPSSNCAIRVISHITCQDPRTLARLFFRNVYSKRTRFFEAERRLVILTKETQGRKMEG